MCNVVARMYTLQEETDDYVNNNFCRGNLEKVSSLLYTFLSLWVNIIKFWFQLDCDRGERQSCDHVVNLFR